VLEVHLLSLLLRTTYCHRVKSGCDNNCIIERFQWTWAPGARIVRWIQPKSPKRPAEPSPSMTRKKPTTLVLSPVPRMYVAVLHKFVNKTRQQQPGIPPKARLPKKNHNLNPQWRNKAPFAPPTNRIIVILKKGAWIGGTEEHVEPKVRPRWA
jgi:hypothetical protein